MRFNKGLTLIELLAALAVAAILAGTAAPALFHMVQDQRLHGALMELHLALRLAHSESLKAGKYTVLCKSGDQRSCTREGGWEQGWIGFVDLNRNGDCADADGDGLCDGDGGRIFTAQGPAGKGSLTLRGNRNIRHRVAFDDRGYADGYPGTFSACDARGVARARGLVLSIVGRIRPAAKGDNVSCPD